jgi:hypothetical protein
MSTDFLAEDGSFVYLKPYEILMEAYVGVGGNKQLSHAIHFSQTFSIRMYLFRLPA